MHTVAFVTLGCKVNQYETELIRESLKRHGIKTVSSRTRADAYIINTCTVTQKTDAQCRQSIYRILQSYPDARIIITGCYAQRVPDEIRNISSDIIIVPNSEKTKIISYIKLRDEIDKDINQVVGISGFRNHTRAFIKIQDGCDAFCTYCIVPYVRSKIISRSPQEILHEARVLAENSYKEIVLTGIRLGMYSSIPQRGTKIEYRLSDLVKVLSDITSIKRIRLSSLEPLDITDNLIETISSLPKVCPHLHIPLQSGDDEVLKNMNRKYTTLKYRELINRIRAKISGISITTDIIAGFPGETDEQFINTCKFIKEIGFNGLHVFRYSMRPGTKASELTEQIPSKTIRQRAKTLLYISKSLKHTHYYNYLNKSVDVLWEGYKNGLYNGLTDNYIRVFLKNSGNIKNTITTVKIDKIDSGYAYGSLV